VKTAALVVAIVLATAPASRAATFVVTSSADRGEGSIREAIDSANSAPGSKIEVAGGSDVEIIIDDALPEISARGTVFDGRGATLREGPDCRRRGGRRGCDGLVVTGPAVVVVHVRAAGFTFDGISVRGAAARGVRIAHVEAIDNLDDGVGVSERAGPVTVEHALLMGNGFRTKGKGLLVFSDATATLRDSIVVANRDGVTVTRGSDVELERVLVVGNYDKGIGISAGRVRGRELGVYANGRIEDAPGPNGDGVRVGLAGSVELSRCRVSGNGDTGVVVLDTSSATLRGCNVEGNLGSQTEAAPGAILDER
jgi:parallel beta-helix repeat protein